MNVRLIILLFAVSTTRGFQSLIPEGKEVTYKYESRTSTDTQYPSSSITTFTLHGNLRLQKHNGSILAQLTDLKYELFNGATNAAHAIETLPIPEHLADFSKTFRIEYLPTGIVEGIAIGAGEQQYVVNFKKGLAAVLQLDTHQIADNDNGDQFSFSSVEETLHRKQKAEYNVKMENWNYYFEVLQVLDGVRGDLISSVEYEEGGNILRRGNQRRLKVVRKDQDAFVEHLKQTGGIFYQPFNGRGEEFTLHSEQTLFLEAISDVKEVMAVEGDEKTLKGLHYHQADFKAADTIFPDFTNGRRIFHNDLVVEHMCKGIKQTVNSIAQMKLSPEAPDFMENHFINALTYSLLFFDEKMFGELEDKLAKEENAKELLNMFHVLLPDIGTHASYNHMLNMREARQIDDSLFCNMFGSVKYPNKKLVEAMGKEILSWKNEISEVYNCGILSFATLLHKAASRHEAYKRNGILLEDYPEQKYYETYVLKWVKKLQEAESYELKILYLQALYNTKFDSIIEHLLPVVQSKSAMDDHLRMMMALAMSPVVANNESMAVKIYWPFLSNSKTTSSLRIMAYYIIMKTKPSFQRLMNIYFVMESTKDEELYKFHYNYITQAIKSESMEETQFVKDLKQILLYTKRSYFGGLTTYVNLDYYDKEYAFGERFELLSIHSRKENELIISGSYVENVSGLIAKPSWFLIRIGGFEQRLLQQLKLDTTSSNYLLTWKLFKDALLDSDNVKNAKLTLILASNDQVVSTKSADGKGFHDMLRIIQHVLFDFNVDSSGIQNGLELTKSLYFHLPTDLGFPAMFYDQMPCMDYNKIKISNKMHGDVMKLSFNANLKSVQPYIKSLSFYNPFIDVHQGVEKVVSQELRGDLQFDVSYDMAQGIFKFAWAKPENPDGVLYAERNYVYKTTYVVSDDFQNELALQKSCEKCATFHHVSLGEDYKVSEPIARRNFMEFGVMFGKQFFDIEEQLPNALNPKIDIFVESGNLNDLKDFIKLLIYTRTFEELQPNDVNYGSYDVLQLDRRVPIHNIDITLKLKSEYKKNSNYIRPAVVHKLKLDYIAGVHNQTYRTWLVDAEIAMDEGHFNNEYKLNLLRHFNKHEFLFTIEGDLRYEDDAYKSKTRLIIPQQNTTKEHPMVFIEATGAKSEEQKKNTLDYISCLENMRSPIEHGKSIECFFEHVALRNLTLKIVHAMPGFNHDLLRIMDSLLTREAELETTETIADDELRVYVNMPIAPALDYMVSVYEPTYGQSFKLPDSLKRLHRNIGYESIVALMHQIGSTNTCTINQKDKTVIAVDGEEFEDVASKEWRLYINSKKDGSKFEVWTMATEADNMAIKIVHDENIFTIVPHQKNSWWHVAWPNKSMRNVQEMAYDFSINGNQMKPEQTYFKNKWLHYAWVKNSPIVAVFMRNIGVHIIYNGNQANIEYPEVEGVEWSGICIKK